MGEKQSKVLQNSGDPQAQILNQLDVHEELYHDLENKLLIILAIVIIHLAITLYRIYKENSKRQVINAAKTVADLREIWTFNEIMNRKIV